MAERTWSAHVVAIGDRIAALSAASAAELSRYLELAHGVRAGPSPKRLPVPDPDPVAPAAPEPAECDVVLDGSDPARKVAVIRAVREQTGLGLKEALALVTTAAAVVQRRLPRAQAEQLRDRLRAAGAEVTVRPAPAT